MNSTSKGERPHIAVFGRRNVGKSTFINRLTNQNLSLVSDQPGTTTDPVYKAMELHPVGPAVIIDTAGIDDTGELGEKRIEKTREVLRRTDAAVLVISAVEDAGDYENNLINEFKKRSIPFIVAVNKIDLLDNISDNKITEVNFLKNKTMIEKKSIGIFLQNCKTDYVFISAEKGKNIDKARGLIADKLPDEDESKNTIIGDLIDPGDLVVLVTPIDSAAPKGRLILPQVQTIRDIIDHNGTAVVSKKEKIKSEIDKLKQKPKIVVTDSQVFGVVSKFVPDDILLTGFSVLFARYKGDLNIFVRGAKAMSELQTGDKVLIAEACTHRRQHDDIGTVKIPNWIHKKISADITFDHTAGRDFPVNLDQYKLILHCGGCMLNRKEVISRITEAEEAGIPVINYGMAIAWLHGILDRALKPFPAALKLWNDSRKK
ncbi:[FeFe] hydrogenase H-cluster maturation GTPase HydF [Halanaerobium sp. MA284_MarDTE_T2]|uniref:[FeFe] hydrogenase H-cluster maturation GTPase HydF n=1 Tax=Halanaerobium sp. MA284_MarDTE_T2 TaxID=2183913 RepID=UPI000DF226F3|nr:[FeFe] hydrogenase H-cluster maturation GTPase HydF [Halanaerobium sp. MA284_MarDTE_T2]RCW41986.1 iron-only hydrogenase maturation protein HydF [Halanaerobium sp. MA284_MarDTE_T2]